MSDQPSPTAFAGSAITGWCARCDEYAVPMRDGTCGFCGRQLTHSKPPPSTSEDILVPEPAVAVPPRSANGAGETPPAEPAIRARLVTITPKLAEQWLKKNTHNRGVVNSRIDQYAADMRRGEWRVNGETIKLAADGRVLDGQHRLMAVLEADVSIQSLVITGLRDEAQETMDQGRARSLADVFKLRGEKYHNPLATAARTLALYERYGTVVQPPYKAPPSILQASRALERNPELRDSVAMLWGLRRPWMPTSHMGALHFLFATVDLEAANDFVTKLTTGAELHRAHPVYVLRELLMTAHMTRDTILQRTQLALIIKAWNAYMAGDEVTRLQWTPGGPRPEPFPSIDGLAEPEGPTE